MTLEKPRAPEPYCTPSERVSKIRRLKEDLDKVRRRYNGLSLFLEKDSQNGIR